MPVHQIENKPPKRSDHTWDKQKWKIVAGRQDGQSMSHWSIQKANNEYRVYGKQALEQKVVRSDCKHGFMDIKKYDNIHHKHAKEGFKYWHKDRRELKESTPNWDGKYKPMGCKGQFLGIPVF